MSTVKTMKRLNTGNIIIKILSVGLSTDGHNTLNINNDNTAF